MADDTPPPYDPTSGGLHPELGQFKAPEELQDWTAQAVSDVQDHLTTKALVDNAAQAQDRFIQNVAQTRDNLIGMVKTDPTAAPMAMGLIDSFPDHMAGMTGVLKTEVARSAVQGLAGQNHAAAHAAIDQYSDHLSDEDQAGLRQYTDNLELLRRHDNLGQALNQQTAQNIGSHQAGLGYLGQLGDDTGVVRYPPNWGQKMFEDPRMSPDDKAGLFTAYKNLQTNGDPETSDPFVMADLIKRAATDFKNPDHPSPSEVFGQAGDNLSLADARYIGAKIGPQSPADLAHTQKMSEAIDDARGQIGNRAAFGRFMDWFMPAARNGGSLDPGSTDFMLTPERMARFQPTGDDVIAPFVPAARALLYGDPDARPTLGSFFSGLGQSLADTATSGLNDMNRMMSGKMLNEPMGGLRTLVGLGGGAIGGVGQSAEGMGAISLKELVHEFSQVGNLGPMHEEIPQFVQWLGSKLLNSRPVQETLDMAQKAQRAGPVVPKGDELRDTTTGRIYNPGTDA